MQILCLSDTHNYFDPAWGRAEADVLLHAGDLTNNGTPIELHTALRNLGSLPYKTKIVIAGNHDLGIDQDGLYWQVTASHYGIRLVTHGGTELKHDVQDAEPIRIACSSYTPQFGDWAFMYERDSPDSLDRWSSIPDNTEILVTHGPAYGILDTNIDGTHCGCQDLRDRIRDLPNLKYHIFGHIHEQSGKQQVVDGVTHCNVSIMNTVHQPTGFPRLINI